MYDGKVVFRETKIYVINNDANILSLRPTEPSLSCLIFFVLWWNSRAFRWSFCVVGSLESEAWVTSVRLQYACAHTYSPSLYVH